MEEKRKGGLVLTRKSGQSIVIATPLGQVVITFTKITHSNWIRMRFSMPDSIQVLRAEVLTEEQQMKGITGNGN